MTMVGASSPVPRRGSALEGFVYALGRAVSALTMGFSSRALNGLGWMLFLGTALAVDGSQAFAPVSAQDEGQLLTYPWLIAQGSVPYRDIWMSYPPAVFMVLALLFKLGWSGLLLERGLGIVAALFFVLVANRICARRQPSHNRIVDSFL